ncbi:hypothetical protein R5W60_06860 [Brucella pseudintermedia]|uniref:hypothetical protein n=1 Tax=Brucella pseudintermedia TaxID=370111 RepID=UPI00367166AC|nr:hypothetical protein R5W60_06860 [Brucella pseudintermedia]
MSCIEDDLSFRVDQWSDDGDRLEYPLSFSLNALIAEAAFHAAVKLRPHKRITCRHKARVIREYVPENLRLLDEQRREELERNIQEARRLSEERRLMKGG